MIMVTGAVGLGQTAGLAARVGLADPAPRRAQPRLTVHTHLEDNHPRL